MSVADEEGDPILFHQQKNLFVYKSYNSCSKTSQERGVEIVVVKPIEMREGKVPQSKCNER